MYIYKNHYSCNILFLKLLQVPKLRYFTSFLLLSIRKTISYGVYVIYMLHLGKLFLYGSWLLLGHRVVEE